MHKKFLEGGSHTLSTMSAMAKRTSEKYLKELGVILKTGFFVQNYDGNILKLNNGEVLKSKNVIWAAGITGNSIEGLPSTLQGIWWQSLKAKSKSNMNIKIWGQWLQSEETRPL